MKPNVHIVLVGGGSGGHFYPLMSIAEALRAHPLNPKLHYMGPEPYGTSALDALGIKFVWCPSGKRRKYISIQNFFDLFKIFFGFFVALTKLYKIYPDVVVSKGGYTSVPVVLAAWFLQIPIVIHESDALPGTANKLGASFARYIGVAYPETMKAFKSENVQFVGIPIRSELLAPALPDVRNELGIDNELPILLVLGGSQGAERVNSLILDSLDELLPDFNIIHQTGTNLFKLTALSAHELITDSTLIARYRPAAFLGAQQLNQALHAATLVISRAGSGSIHEIAVHEKPAILIPIPEEISHDQRTNAYTYAAHGGAIVIEERNLQDSLLREEIDRIMQNEVLYESMVNSAKTFAKRDAAQTLTDAIVQISKSH